MGRLAVCRSRQRAGGQGAVQDSVYQRVARGGVGCQLGDGQRASGAACQQEEGLARVCAQLDQVASAGCNLLGCGGASQEGGRCWQIGVEKTHLRGAKEPAGQQQRSSRLGGQQRAHCSGGFVLVGVEAAGQRGQLGPLREIAVGGDAAAPRQQPRQQQRQQPGRCQPACQPGGQRLGAGSIQKDQRRQGTCHPQPVGRLHTED